MLHLVYVYYSHIFVSCEKRTYIVLGTSPFQNFQDTQNLLSTTTLQLFAKEVYFYFQDFSPPFINMKASSAILAIFSGLAIATPAINARQNIDKAKAALKVLDDKTSNVKADTEKSLKDQADRKAAWKERSTKEVDLSNKLTDLLKDGTAEEKDATKQLADLINVAAKGADEAAARLEQQVSTL